MGKLREAWGWRDFRVQGWLGALVKGRGRGWGRGEGRGWDRESGEGQGKGKGLGHGVGAGAGCGRGGWRREGSDRKGAAAKAAVETVANVARPDICSGAGNGSTREPQEQQ